MNSYEERKQRLSAEVAHQRKTPLRLNKATSNLFRSRRRSAPAHALDVNRLDHVLDVNRAEGWVEVEGMTRYADLIDVTLPLGVMPAVVPELKSITIGGAVSGVGIESSSFKYGLVHETIFEMDVLLGDGRVIQSAPDNEYSDLFFGFPNSYGTLGYALRLKAKTIPVKGYVELRHLRYHDAARYFQELADWCQREVDFIDGVIFSPRELYLTIGTFVDTAPYTSDYTFKHIYYRSIRQREQDYLTTHHYLWRWDTDWFWCSKNLLAQNPLIRRLYGPKRLNSITYTQIMRWNARWGLTKGLNRLLGKHTESVIQDVDIPLERAPAFLDSFHRDIGIHPIWICPIRAYRRDRRFGLYPLDPDIIYVNFGFWDSVSSRERFPPGYFNRRIERKVSELGGIKSLYSDSYYLPDEFWSIYSRDLYQRLKARYDPDNTLRDIYQKCVLRQ